MFQLDAFLQNLPIGINHYDSCHASPTTIASLAIRARESVEESYLEVLEGILCAYIRHSLDLSSHS